MDFFLQLDNDLNVLFLSFKDFEFLLFIQVSYN